MGGTLTEAGLAHIVGHKYVSGNYSPLEKLLNPWWLCISNHLPRWLAPNLITCTGLLPLVVVQALHWVYCPTFIEPPPRWLYFLGAAALFFYQTTDAVDGKQARRIGASSPLGQLMDHGCDALCSLSHHSQLMLVLLPGPSLQPLLVMVSLMTGFFLAQWEEFFTGVLNTSAGPIGVTELQYLLMSLLVVAGISGGESVAQFMAVEVCAGFQVRHVLIDFWLALSTVLAACSLRRTYHSVQGTDQLWAAPAMLIPVVILATISLMWSHEARHTSHRLVLWATGLEYVYITCKLIVVSMAKQCFTFNHWAHSVGSVCVVVALSHFIEGWRLHTLLIVFNVALTAAFFVWVRRTVSQIASRLGIFVFSVKKVSE
mmetsp:Transcript_59456/g.110024  ORF Transcript_59456/g.110024 Transcript_59456/m.110024 type:complete len:372 (-) Transcript_59456:77-1192(-)